MLRSVALLVVLAWPVGGHAAGKDIERGKDATSAAVIKWVVPWREGVELRYAAEDYEDEQGAKGRERTRTTSIETIRITEARDAGYLQEWSYADARYEVLEGSPAAGAVMQGIIDSLADLVVEVDLDAAGNYSGIRNLANIGQRMRPLMKAGLAAGLGSAPATGTADGMKYLDAMVDRLTAPEVLEMLLSEDVVQYNDFVGAELEEGRHYEVDVELDNPLVGGSLPARVTFGAYARESEPDDVFLEWTTRLDPEKAAEAALAFADKVFDEGIVEAARAQVPELSIVDKGFVLFRRSTGVVELLEATRTIRAAGETKIERRRMRLLGADHDHEWADDGPPVAAEEPLAAQGAR